MPGGAIICGGVPPGRPAGACDLLPGRTGIYQSTSTARRPIINKMKKLEMNVSNVKCIHKVQ